MFDVQFAFQAALKAIAAATDQILDNVYDAGANILLFDGYSRRPAKMFAAGKVTAGAVTQVRVRLVGASDAILTGSPVVLADTGLSAVIANGVRFNFEIPVTGQLVAKRYYGMWVTTVGAAGTVNVNGGVRFEPQSNMLFERAAAPA